MIAKEGLPFIIGFAALSGVLAAVEPWLGPVSAIGKWVATAGAVACACFFRDLPRQGPSDPKLILAPADGKVTEVTVVEGEGLNSPSRVVRIFLSVFDGHIQRAPVAGRVETIRYQEGKFWDARDQRAAVENEHNMIQIRANGVLNNEPVLVKQIAGLIARRIVCWVKPGETVERGQKLGLIRFGSQVNVYLPMHVNVRVAPGDRVLGGATVIGVVS